MWNVSESHLGQGQASSACGRELASPAVLVLLSASGRLAALAMLEQPRLWDLTQLEVWLLVVVASPSLEGVWRGEAEVETVVMGLQAGTEGVVWNLVIQKGGAGVSRLYSRPRCPSLPRQSCLRPQSPRL